MSNPQTQAQQRALLIMQVRTGQITATAAAQQLNLSRKTYYQWENRGLNALLESQIEQPPGRPPKAADPEKEQLRRKVAQLEQQITELEQVQKLREIVQQLQASDAKKNSRSCPPSSTKPPPPSPLPG